MTLWRFCSEVFFAGLGTMAFSLIFHVPARYYPRCGLTGAAGWLVFIALKGPVGTLTATFSPPWRWCSSAGFPRCSSAAR